MLSRSAVGFRLDEQVQDRIVAEPNGNPLALLELPRGLGLTQLAGGFGLMGAVPARIEQISRRRIEALPGDTRRLMLVATAEPTGDPELVWRAAERLEVPASGIQTGGSTPKVVGPRGRVSCKPGTVALVERAGVTALQGHQRRHPTEPARRAGRPLCPRPGRFEPRRLLNAANKLSCLLSGGPARPAPGAGAAPGAPGARSPGCCPTRLRVDPRWRQGPPERRSLNSKGQPSGLTKPPHCAAPFPSRRPALFP